jgi:hypothetical protein
MAEIEIPLHIQLRRAALEPDFDIEIVRDEAGKVVRVITDKQEIEEYRNGN